MSITILTVFLERLFRGAWQLTEPRVVESAFQHFKTRAAVRECKCSEASTTHSTASPGLGLAGMGGSHGVGVVLHASENARNDSIFPEVG